MAAICRECGGLIEQRDIGPTMQGKPLLRWGRTDRKLIGCPTRTGHYCVPEPRVTA